MAQLGGSFDSTRGALIGTPRTANMVEFDRIALAPKLLFGLAAMAFGGGLARRDLDDAERPQENVRSGQPHDDGTSLSSALLAAFRMLGCAACLVRCRSAAAV